MAARAMPVQSAAVTSTGPGFTLLLPARAALQGAPGIAPMLARVISRSDPDTADPGDEAQLQRQFDILPRGLPVAALTRDHDMHDAGHQTWLRADPAHVRADLGTGRLMACGELGLSLEDAEALLAPLKPLFGDEGCPVSIGAPSRWYLALPRDARLPVFSPPSRVLGDDIYAHLPEGEPGRRWRRLLSEAQVILHNHPLNAARVAAGKLPVNSLWFWGGGLLPDHVRSRHAAVFSDDLLCAALCRRADLPHRELPASFEAIGDTNGGLVDLRRIRDVAILERDWIAPLLVRLAAAGNVPLHLDFADGSLHRYRRHHRWRVWRRAPTSFA
jgi:hypothetical protein